MNLTSIRNNPIRFAALLLVLAGIAMTAERATLAPSNTRKPAPDFALRDASGTTATLNNYRDKVVLVNFWATWCGGCKEEMPFFAELHRTYGEKGLSVVGISLDQDGWSAVKPFLAKTDIPFRILLGDDRTSRRYAINALPDTFLIDRQGKIAAAYMGVVDKDSIEANIKALLAER